MKPNGQMWTPRASAPVADLCFQPEEMPRPHTVDNIKRLERDRNHVAHDLSTR